MYVRRKTGRTHKQTVCNTGVRGRRRASSRHRHAFTSPSATPPSGIYLYIDPRKMIYLFSLCVCKQKNRAPTNKLYVIPEGGASPSELPATDALPYHAWRYPPPVSIYIYRCRYGYICISATWTIDLHKGYTYPLYKYVIPGGGIAERAPATVLPHRPRRRPPAV